MNLSSPITSCRLCASTSLCNILDLNSTPAGDHYLPAEDIPQQLPLFSLNLRQCHVCGHVQLGGLVDPAYIYRNYIYTTSSSLGLAAHFADYAHATVAQLQLEPGSRVVEIGSNDGTMLRAFKKLGMQVLGVDPATSIAELATQSGIPTLAEFFTTDLAQKIRADQGPADLIVANNVFANVSNPVEFACALRELLAPDGTLILETGYLRYLAEDVAFDNIYHEHIDYHAIRPLVRFFDSLGMTLFDVHVTSSKGSSIRCMISHASAQKPVAKQVDLLAQREIDLSYQRPEPYSALARHLETTKTTLHAILEPARRSGLRIAGFGASVGVTTMLYHWKLAPFIPMLLDDNPRRHGLRSPGLGIPVQNPAQIDQEPPALVVLLAWRYSDAIIKKYSHWLSKGTRFLQVLPNVKVLDDTLN